MINEKFARKSCGATKFCSFATQALSFAPFFNKAANLWAHLIAPKATFSSIRKIDEKVGLAAYFMKSDLADQFLP